MELEEAREKARMWERMIKREYQTRWLRVVITLNNRITELEAERLHLRTLIRSEQIKPPFDIEDDVTTELAVALADMEKQRDELVEARKTLLNTEESDDLSVSIDMGYAAIEKAEASDKEE